MDYAPARKVNGQRLTAADKDHVWSIEALRLLFFGGPLALGLWPTIRETPAFGISLSIVVVSLANFIVWKVEQMTPFPQDESH